MVTIRGNLEHETKEAVYTREWKVTDQQKANPSYKVFDVISSGYSRKGYTRLLELIQSRAIEKVVVADTDMLARVEAKVFERIINSTGGRLVVQGSHNECPKQELGEDNMAIFHTFHCRLTSQKGVPGQKKKRLATSSEQMSPLPSSVDATTTHLDEENVHGL